MLHVCCMCVACVLHLCCTCVAFVLHVMGQGLIKKHEADMLPQEEALAELLRGMLVRVLLQVCCKCVACWSVSCLLRQSLHRPPSTHRCTAALERLHLGVSAGISLLPALPC